MPEFPSVEWFQAVGRRTEEDKQKFKLLGYVDADVGIKIDGNGAGTRSYLLKFRDYGVTSVEETKDLSGADFSIEGGLDAWTEMVRNIMQNGEADIEHSLNRLTMADVPLKVVARDQLQADIFSRFNQSFQAFFNEAAHVPTETSKGTRK
jgi:hypothetical protein